MDADETVPRTGPQMGSHSRVVHMALAALAFTMLLLAAASAPLTASAESLRKLRIVALGDSLTAGYGLPAADAFPARLESALKAAGFDVEVANAGVSGDTTAAGLARLDWALGEGADAVIVELGANDMLRGIDPAVARRNLDTILTRIEALGAPVLLAGMRALGNWGADYQSKFEAIFPDLAKAHRVALYPFFLDGVIGVPAMSLPDGLHPNAAGVAEIVRRILPAAEVLAKAAAARPAK